ncbi:N-acetylmuramoyl-L-alanine amidase [Paenibacillus beijingensis]|uniref:MurNAc-LAA domain-containing protein n=1 Tax=Paenibacillus beijingensis TaxID=1126833 RepID=A0A0D5NPE2_9BACL|nr:N-acetylmuramoyl-L-alanine amidase [Paenibacillus beijingensis]AJY77116.1 hypothetical protein VN24_24430 [Paenibacillus beijingensis]
MKKFVCMLLFMTVLISLFAAVSYAAVNDVPKLYLNGKQMVSSGNPPKIVKGTTFVPIRTVAEGMGFDVSWDQKSKTVGIHNELNLINLVIGGKTAEVNGQQMAMSAPAQIFNDKTYKSVTMVPLRFVSENMGLEIYYDKPANSVYVYQPEPAPVDDGSSGGGDASGNAGGDSGTGSGAPAAETPPVDVPGTVTPPVDAPATATPPADATAFVKGIEFDGLGTTTIRFDGTMNGVQPTVLTGPDRIMLDLPYSAFADGFTPAFPSLTSRMGELVVDTHPTLSKIRFSFYSDKPSTVRVVWDLSAKTQHSFTQGDGILQLSLLGPDQAVPPVSTAPDGSKIFKVVIDAGHGSQDPGATSVSGRKEKDFNLSLALKVNDLLKNEQRIAPYMTRSDDTFLELNDRATFANDLQADLFISLHGNALPGSPASGTETYYYSAKSKALAEIIHKKVLEAAGLPDRSVRTAGFVVVKKTTMPSVLLETGFLTNRTDEAVMFSESKQQEIAAAIVAGIKEYLQLS